MSNGNDYFHTKQIIKELILKYDDLRIQYYVLISKLNANSEHGKDYGLKCSLINSDILTSYAIKPALFYQRRDDNINSQLGHESPLYECI